MSKAVIFDLNGVFLKSESLSARFERAFGVKEKVFWSIFKEILVQVRQPQAISVYELLLPHFQQWDVQISEKEFYDFWFGGESLDKEMVLILQELKNLGWQVFILSNNLKERSLYYRSTMPELKLFDKVYFSWETGYIKPDKRAFDLILQENNLSPEDCFYFDDSEGNVKVGNSLKIKSYLFKSPAQVKKILFGD